MTDLKLDPATNDLVVEANTVVIVDGVEETAQRLRQRLRTFLGEWFLDLSIGLPYFQEIMAKGARLDRVGAYFKREILATPGVVEPTAYEQTLDRPTRKLSITFGARDKSGAQIQLSEVI